MVEAKVRGQFVWHDLITAEPAAAAQFYPKFVPWKTQSWEKDPTYTMWVAKGGPVGGIMPLSDTASASGAKAHWLPYIATLDLEQTIGHATKLGALVVTRPTELGNGGRYAVLADPQGAVFGVYASADTPLPGAPKPGEFSWHEHLSDDCEKTFAFYQALFGWEKLAEHDMGAMGIYLIFGVDGVQLGGIFNKPAGMPAAHWSSYVCVKSADSAAAAVKKAGGQVILGPTDVPGGDRIAQILDPQGALFAVHSFKQVAAEQPAPKPAAPAAEKAPAPKVAAKPKKKTPKTAAKPAAKTKAPAKKSSKKAAKKAVKKTKKAIKKKVGKKKVRPMSKKVRTKVATKKAKSASKKSKSASKKKKKFARPLSKKVRV